MPICKVCQDWVVSELLQLAFFILDKSSIITANQP